MALVDEIRQAVISAMKAKDNLKLQTARMAQSALKNKEIELKAPLSEADAQKVLQTMVKQRKDSESQFREAGRDELAEKERLESEFLQSFLPEQMDEAELEKIVLAAVEQSGASSSKDMGQVMKLVMPQVAGRADGKSVQQATQKILKQRESA